VSEIPREDSLQRLARLLLRRWPQLWLVLVLTGLLAALLLWRVEKFDAEILHLLPRSEPAVQGMIYYQHEFTQAREIAFFFESPEDPALFEEFRALFVDQLKAEPWVQRVVDSSPLETARGRETLASMALPLLLHLPQEEFVEVLAALEPDRMQERLNQLAQRWQAGSPVAAVELQLDPLGLLRPLTTALTETIPLDEGFALTNEETSAQIVSIITNQQDLDPESCRATMGQVRHFLQQIAEDFGEGAPEVFVTGRSAYVEEISASMKRDILLTSLVSALGISLLFLLVYGGLRPLAGLLLLLALAALFALTLGLLLFPSLNLIAIGFCSILFGLGTDFGLLLLENYRRRYAGDPVAALAETWRARWPGIAGVAATTAVGFLALTLGSSEGFAQLGVLTACGIALCAVLFPLAYFPFFAGHHQQTASAPPSRFLRYLLEPGKIGGTILVILIAGAAFVAFRPGPPIRFDVSPRSLEPRHTPAAVALQKMMEAFPATFEPLLLVLPVADPALARPRVAQLEDTLRQWQKEGFLSSFAGASPLVLVPENATINLSLSRQIPWLDVEQNLASALSQAGLQLPPDHPTRQLLSAWASATKNPHPAPTWNTLLPPDSPWWFLLDRTLAPEGNLLLLYVRPHPEHLARLVSELEQQYPEVLVTGWSFLLEQLRPWAMQELQLFGLGVGSAIFLLLALFYRNWRMWCVHLLSAMVAICFLVASLRWSGASINLLNILAFPLIIGVGVDYATHWLLALREPGASTERLQAVFRPVLVSGTTTMIGFGALTLAENPALSGLGWVCLLGVGSCLLSACLVVLPLSRWVQPENNARRK
jgi:predicted RND superfamily exporter protein